MASVNKVILVGNLGADPETRYMPSGDAIANIRLATTDKWKDKQSGEQKEATEWHRVAFFGRLAEIVGQYCKKGSQVYIEGRIRTRKWQDKESGQDRYSTEIVADMLQLLGSRQGQSDAPAREYGGGAASGGRASGGGENRAPAKKAPAGGFGDMDDDIPF